MQNYGCVVHYGLLIYVGQYAQHKYIEALALNHFVPIYLAHYAFYPKFILPQCMSPMHFSPHTYYRPKISRPQH